MGRCIQPNKRFQQERGEQSGKVRPDASQALAGEKCGGIASVLPCSPLVMEYQSPKDPWESLAT